jgi:hypothetical protein
MTPEQIEKERAAFEAWMAELYPTNPKTERVGDEYSRLGTQYKWEGWQARAEQSAWISVEDKLPELNKEVLVVWTDGVFGFATRIETKYHEERWNWETAALSETITHWQPLTEPPKAA